MGDNVDSEPNDPVIQPSRDWLLKNKHINNGLRISDSSVEVYIYLHVLYLISPDVPLKHLSSRNNYVLTFVIKNIYLKRSLARILATESWDT